MPIDGDANPHTPHTLRCQREYEFGQLRCERDEGHPGLHLARWWGDTIWFTTDGRRVEGGSAEDYA